MLGDLDLSRSIKVDFKRRPVISCGLTADPNEVNSDISRRQGLGLSAEGPRLDIVKRWKV